MGVVSIAVRLTSFTKKHAKASYKLSRHICCIGSVYCIMYLYCIMYSILYLYRTGIVYVLYRTELVDHKFSNLKNQLVSSVSCETSPTPWVVHTSKPLKVCQVPRFKRARSARLNLLGSPLTIQACTVKLCWFYLHSSQPEHVVRSDLFHAAVASISPR